MTNSRFIGNDTAILGVGGDFSLDRVLVQDSSYQSAHLSNNQDPWNGLRQRWTFTRSNLLPPVAPSCSYGGRCTVHVSGSNYPIEAAGVWWGTTNTSEINQLIYDGKDAPGLPSVSLDPPASSPYDLYPPTSTLSIPSSAYVKSNVRSLAGSATDGGAATSGIAEVTVSLQDLRTGQYWDGAAWGPSERFRRASGTSAWSIAIPLLVDGHRYRARSLAKDAADNVQWGAASAIFTADGAPPTAVAPQPSLVVGSTLGTTALPVKLEWSGADNLAAGGLRFDLDERAERNGVWGPWLPVLGATAARSTSRLLDPSTPYNVRVRARDLAGNTSAYMTAPKFRAIPFQESASSSTLTYAGSWAPLSNASAYGGAVRSTTTAGSRATLTFLGRSIAVVMPRGSTLGSVQVCLDRGLVEESCDAIDLAAGTLGARKMVFTRNSLDPTITHTVDVTAVSGRADVDAFVTLR